MTHNSKAGHAKNLWQLELGLYKTGMIMHVCTNSSGFQMREEAYFACNCKAVSIFQFATVFLIICIQYSLMKE